MTDLLGNLTNASSEIQLGEVEEEESFFYLLCNEPLWDYSRAWQSSSPQFGSCVERTILVWIPCGFLWLLSPFYFFFLRRKPHNPIPWTALNCSKMVLSLILMVTSATELGWASWQHSSPTLLVPMVDILAPVILLITYIIHLTLIHVGRLRGERTCGLLWVFWLIMLLSGIPQLITSITTLVYMDGEMPLMLVATFIVQYVVSFCLFITNWFCDAPSKLQLLTMTDKPSPELSASFPSQLMYWWCGSAVWLGWRRPLVFDDLWDINPMSKAANVSEQWHADFNKKAKYKKDSYSTGKETGKKCYLYWRLWRMCRGEVAFLGFLYFSAEMMRFITPQLLGLLIQFINDANEPTWHGYLYAVSLLMVCESSSILKNKYFFIATNLSLNLRSAIMSAVYRKAINLSGSARRESTIGQIVNMMAVDAVVIGETGWQLCNIIGAPVVIIVAMGFLWVQLGPSVLAGLAVLLLMIPVNSYLANKTKECQLECIKLRDKRVKMVSEIIGGIKVLKLYAWEASYAKQVQDVREEEINYFRKIAYLQSFSSFFFHVSPYVVSLATFTTYLFVSKDNILDAELAFVSIALFNIMRLPIVQMPSVIAQVIQSSVALKRIKKFLSSDELDLMAVCSDRSEEGHLVIRKGQFSWEGADGESTWSLRDVEMNIKPGQLVAVIGSVGAGKSSLISALLGEMRKEAGKVVVNGRIAYVSQQAWLQNATLRDNITWGQPYDEKWYNKVVEACALLPDLEMLEGGDMTEIGENGLNLSGGQKQRISLARAVYRNADILLLDDPLSAVDAHVGKHIFDHVLGPQGLLRSKTRLLVTHSVTFLPQVDEVIVVKDGRLVESGSYSDLLAADGDFAQFIVQYINSCEEEEAGEELLELYGQLESVPSGGVIQRQISEISSTGSHKTSARQDISHNIRQRSISECYEERKKRTPHNSCLHLNQSNGNLSHHLFERQLQKQISNGGSLHMSNSGSQHIYHSKSSINSAVSREQKSKSGVENQPRAQNLIDEELQETGKVARYVYVVYGKAMGAAFAILPFISLALGQASVAGSNVWLSLWSTSGNMRVNASLANDTSEADSSALEGEGTISRDIFLAGYGMFGVAQAFFIFVGMLLVMLGCLRAANTLHRGLLDSVIRLPMSFFDTNPSGRVINRFSKEMSTLDFTLPNIVRALLSCFTQVIATLLVIVGSTPIAIVALLPIMAVYYMIQVVYVATSRQIKRIESVSKSPIYSHFSESIQGVSIIRAFKKQDEFIQESLNKIDRFIKAVSLNISANRWVAIHLETLGNIVTFSAAMMAVLGRETISPGVVGLSVTYALNVTMVLNWVVRVASDLEANIVSVERINEYLQKEQEAAWFIKDKTPSKTWPEEGSISFNSYETRYRPGLDLVLRGVTCSFKPAEKIGIVGRTGAGKSSLTLALFRLIEPSGGSIQIDGVNISSLGLHELRSRLSIIPQDPVLFSGTLRLNLDPFGDRSDVDVWRALELAHLKEYIKSQPLGLQHVVDEDGSNFSVGQRQLVCLARALLRRSRILVLDEATAAIDLETDDLIQTTIREQFQDCTVITIAHRINTIMDCDRVLVLDQGRIAEFDTPKALLQNSDSIFCGMAKDAGITS